MKKHTSEFSKLVLMAVSAAALIIILFTMIMIVITRDLSPLAYIVPGVISWVDVAIGFYYSKAKAENLLKLKKQAKEEGIDYDPEVNEP